MNNNIKIHKELLMEMDKKITKKEQSHFSDVIGAYLVLSTKEEIFMYLSLITALICNYMGHTVLAWVFGIKAVTELISSVVYAIKHRQDKLSS